MTRRLFDTLILLFMPFVYAVCIIGGAVRFLMPLRSPLRPTRTVVGPLSDFREGLVKPVEFNGRSVYVLMESDRPIALDRTCTHLACSVHWKKDRFVCPCHNGLFDRSGNVLGKPPAAPLARLECIVVGETVVLLDPEAGKA
jgi:cytochrome b6-f complex iron-sulfur subunit